MDTFEMAH